MTKGEQASWVALGLLITGIIIAAVINHKDKGMTDNIRTSKGAINNPGNIIKSATVYQGEIDTPSCCMKSFRSMADGYRAMIVIIRYYFHHYHLTNLYDILKRYSGDENTANYAEYVAVASGLTKYQDLTSIIDTDVVKDIVRGMSLWEQDPDKFVVNDQWVNDGYNLV